MNKLAKLLVATLHRQMFNPIQFSKSHVNRAHPRLRNKSEAVVKTADQAGPPPQLSPAQSNPTSHLLRGVRGRNNWRPGQCVRVCVCVCLGESSRVRGHVRMHQRWWHKAEPRLDLTRL